MSRFCSKCGNEVVANTKFCSHCGEKLEESNEMINKKMPIIPFRNIVISVVLSFLTCGIYGIYWFIVMTDESNNLSEDPTCASGGMAVLYTILTCGIYGIYWNYKMGKKLAEAGRLYDIPIVDNSVLYLILAIFRLDVVNYCLIQSDLNKFAK